MKPNTVKSIIWINWIRLIIILVLVFIAMFVIYQQPEKGILTGIANPVLNRISSLNLSGNNDNIAGSVLGLFLLPICFVILEIVLLAKRKKTVFWIILALDLLFVIGNKGLPLLLIVVFILALTRATRDYLKGTNKIAS